MTISESLHEAAKILRANEIAEAVREAKSLLAFVLKKNQTFLIAHSEYELTDDEAARLREFVARRAKREPFQYIVGEQEFYNLKFLVSEAVLIPRPETEILVEAAIDVLPANGRFCEVGIGSGCISVAVLHIIETARAVGLDISEAALNIARVNAENNSVADRLELRISDVFSNLSPEKFDLIVSNPPYIARADIENLQAEVRDYEPRKALTDEADGLSIVRRIVEAAPEFLKPEGFLLMEIGFGQAAAVGEMFDENVWREIEILPDLQSIPRTVKARINRNSTQK